VHTTLAGHGSSFAVLVRHDEHEPLACDERDEGDHLKVAYDVFRDTALDACQRELLIAAGPVGSLACAVESAVVRLGPCGIADVTYVAAGEPHGVSCFVATAAAAARRMTRHRRRRLEHIAARLSLGCHLLGAGREGDTVDLRTLAQGAEQDGRDPLDPARAWRDLLRGGLMPVDQFDAGGRRYVIAQPMARRESLPRRLSEREQVVVELVARGYANKHIAIELGIAEQSVATYLARAKAKLGVATRIDLIRLVRASTREDA
jgi:DNA-binding CsgD family transcriptional regulator